MVGGGGTGACDGVISIAVSGSVCLGPPAAVRLDGAPESARVRSALRRRWQQVCRRRRIESALIRRAIIIPELLVAEINEGADHESKGCQSHRCDYVADRH